MSIPLPDHSIKIRISYIFSAVCLFVGMGIAIGSYRETLNGQKDNVKNAQVKIENIEQDLSQIHSDIAALTQAVKDLKESIDKN